MTFRSSGTTRTGSGARRGGGVISRGGSERGGGTITVGRGALAAGTIGGGDAIGDSCRAGALVACVR
jgi:hypothetical protein